MLLSTSLRRFRPLLALTNPLPPPSLRFFSKPPSPEEEEDKETTDKRKPKTEKKPTASGEEEGLPPWAHIISTGTERSPMIPSCRIHEANKPPTYHICPTQEEVDGMMWWLNKLKMKEGQGAAQVKNQHDIVDVQPTEVVFPYEFNRVSLASFQLTNKSDDQTVKFKFDMTQHRVDVYKIKPEFGVLQPGETVDIKVERKPVPELVLPMALMLASVDEFVAEITKTGEVVQTVAVRAFTPKPPGYGEGSGEEIIANLHLPEMFLRAARE